MRTTAAPVMTERQSARIERILEATKQLLGEVGADKLTMRDVALASGVAEGTLYNRFGTKDGLLTTAVLDYFQQAIELRVMHRREQTPLRKLIFSAEVVVDSIMQAQGFARALMSTYFRIGNDRSMPTELAKAIRKTWMPILTEMSSAQQLAPWIALDLLARDLCDREMGVVLKWAQGDVPDTQFRDALIFALLMPLLAVSAGKQAKDIEAELIKLNRKLRR